MTSPTNLSLVVPAAKKHLHLTSQWLGACRKEISPKDETLKDTSPSPLTVGGRELQAEGRWDSEEETVSPALEAS